MAGMLRKHWLSAITKARFSTDCLVAATRQGIQIFLRMKPIRFGDLVRNSGRPHTLALWTEPKKIGELQQAIRSNRVLTVRHPNFGTKRYVGIIGSKQGPLSSYLIFPRPLQAGKDQSVIGINYLLIDEDAPSDALPVRKSPTGRAPRAHVTSQR